MSFKYQAQQVGNSEWLLEKGVSTPIHIFMNQTLYDGSEEEMWKQATWATTIPSVQKIIITPDAHVGAGVPVGVVVATKEYIAPCAAAIPEKPLSQKEEK
jgi:RNA-splicing ligase RtcB